MYIIDCIPPMWFGGPQIVMQGIFALVTFLVAFYAFKVYKLSKHRPTAFFSLAFAGLSAGYIIQALLNFLGTQGVSSAQLLGTVMSEVNPAFQLSILAVFLHIFVMTASLILLAYITFRERGIKLFLLISTLSFVALLFSHHIQVTFFIITGILLLFITAQHMQRHFRKPTHSTLFVFLGFGLLFLGQMQLALAHVLSLMYVSGHITMLGGFICLVVSLARVMMKRK